MALSQEKILRTAGNLIADAASVRPGLVAALKASAEAGDEDRIQFYLEQLGFPREVAKVLFQDPSGQKRPMSSEMLDKIASMVDAVIANEAGNPLSGVHDFLQFFPFAPSSPALAPGEVLPGFSGGSG